MIFFLMIFSWATVEIFSEVLFLPINWTEVARLKSMQNTEHSRSFDVSSMPSCDLTAHSCDLECCIDPDCTMEQTNLSMCSSLELNKNERNLSTCDNLGSFWPSFLCTEANNAAILGYHYEDLKKLENLVDFQKILYDRSPYTYKNMSYHLLNDDSKSTYDFGTDIQIYEDQVAETRSLALPYPMVGTTSCTTLTTVPFLINKKWTCRQPLTAQECESSHSPFDLIQYAFSGENASLWQEIDIFPPKVVKNLDKRSFSLSDISFRSPKSAADPFTTSSDYFEVKPPLSADNFPSSQISGLKRGYKDLSAFINTTFDRKQRICRNAVVGVELEFEWHGNEIIKLNAKYTLEDIHVSSEGHFYEENIHRNKQRIAQNKKFNRREDLDVFVTQTFKINFKYSHFEEKFAASAGRQIVSIRSGNPGYHIGRPIIAGILRYNVSDGNSSKDVHSVLWENSHLRIWRGGKSVSFSNMYLEVLNFICRAVFHFLFKQL